MSWSNTYIGIPKLDLGRTAEGADCWGLTHLIYREELGVTLPEYLGYGSTEEHGEIAALIAGATSTPLWVPVSGPAIAFDISVFRRGRLSSHVGIVVRHGLMIHMGNDHAVLEDYRHGPWARRLTGHWRYVDRARRQPVPVQILSEARR